MHLPLFFPLLLLFFLLLERQVETHDTEVYHCLTGYLSARKEWSRVETRLSAVQEGGKSLPQVTDCTNSCEVAGRAAQEQRPN